MIVPDDHLKVPMTNGESLNIHGLFDSIHYYQPLDVHWLRYQMPEDNQIAIVTIQEDLAERLLDQTNLPYVIRESIYQREHDALVNTLSRWIISSELDFAPEEIWQPDEGEIDEEVEE